MRHILRMQNEDIQLIDLNEARRNPDLNPKISAYDALKPYSEEEDCYISFTSIDKLGINPKSDFNTPLGIYFYPLKEIWKKYNVDRKKSVGRVVPFAGDNPYIWLVRKKKNIKFVDDMYNDYKPKDYEKDVEILKNDIIKNPKNYEGFYKFLETIFNRENLSIEETIEKAFDGFTREAKERNAIMFMWNITRKVATFSGKGRSLIKWNTILYKVLGYYGFADKLGSGYIHPSEPVQAVFFSTRGFDVIGEFLNKDYNQNLPKWLQDANYEGKVFYENDSVIFHSGIWKNGTWHNGTWKGGVWLNGTWEYGTWKDGIWEDGYWRDGTWYKGSWKGGTWKDGIWYDGVWQKGLWKDGLWYSGTWQGGVWQKGIWMDGTWKDGAWDQGIILDPFKKGNRNSDLVTTAFENPYLIKKILDSYDLFYTEEELNEYVFSKLDPKEYFDEKAIYKTLKNKIGL